MTRPRPCLCFFRRHGAFEIANSRGKGGHDTLLRHSAWAVPPFVRQESHVLRRGDDISNRLGMSVVANSRTPNGRYAPPQFHPYYKNPQMISRKEPVRPTFTCLSYHLVTPALSIPPNLSFSEMSHNGSFHFTGSPNFNPNGFAFDNSGPINEPSRGFNPHFNLPNYQHAGPSNLTSRRYLPLHEGGKTGQPYTGVAVPGDLGDFSHLQNPTTAPTTLHRRNEGTSHSPPLRVSSEAHLSVEGYNPTLYPAMVAPRPVGSRYANSPSTFAPAQPCDCKPPLFIFHQTSVTHPIRSARHFSTSLAGVTTGRQDRDALFQVGPSDEESGCK